MRYREMPPARFNMARYCMTAGQAPSDKPAFIVIGADDRTETWTYNALEQAVLRAGYFLRMAHGLREGSRVIIRLRNTSAYPIAFFGAISAALVPIPASPDLSARELEFLLDDSEAAAIILDDTLPHGALRPGFTIISESMFAAALDNGPLGTYADTHADTPAFLVYTSGTTAMPKGVLHAHRSAWGRRPMYRGWYGIGPSDRLLHAGSFNWTYTLGTGLTDPWASGATAIVYTGEKDPAIWPRLIREHRVTFFAAVPGVFRQMLKYADVDSGALGNLRHGLCAGEALPQSVADEWEARAGTPIYEALGQTELSTYISSSPDTPPKSGTVGKPQPGRSVVILPEDGGTEPLQAGEAGLIAVHRSDPGHMLGYWRKPHEEASMFRGEWFLGGDAGVMDEDGYIAHLGRRNDLMNAGGFRVSPLEVEQQLVRHESVAEIAVAEVVVRDGVSIIKAFVVARDGAASDSAALELFAETCLAAYKRPKDYVFIEALPRTANGKVKRAELARAVQIGKP